MPRASATALALTLLALAACGEGQQERRVREDVPRIELVAPLLQHELRGDDGSLLSVRDAVATDGGLLLFDGAADEVWLLSPDATPRLRRVSRPRQFGQSDVFAMAPHSRGLSLLGVDGSLRQMQRSDPDKIERSVRAFAPIHRPLALAEWSDGGWVAVHALLVLQGAAVDSVIVSSVDQTGRVGRVFAFERSGPSREGSFLVDPVSARAIANRVVLTGADPARVITITPAGVSADTLLDTPVRSLNDSEVAGITRLLDAASTPAMIRGARVPDQRPVALSALPFSGGYLVVAQGGEFAEFVDLYCGRKFRRTVLARASLQRVFLVETGVVAIDDPPRDGSDEPDRLAFYRLQDFTSECAT